MPPRRALRGFGAPGQARLDAADPLFERLPLLSHRTYLLISFKKSTPPQNRQLHALIKIKLTVLWESELLESNSKEELGALGHARRDGSAPLFFLLITLKPRV